MRYSDWKLVASLGLILGFLFLIGSVFAYFYAQSGWVYVGYPFRDYAPSLAIVGIGLFVVGFLASERAKEEKRIALKGRLEAVIVVCSYCGTENVRDAITCENCGKKIS